MRGSMEQMCSAKSGVSVECPHWNLAELFLVHSGCSGWFIFADGSAHWRMIHWKLLTKKIPNYFLSRLQEIVLLASQPRCLRLGSFPAVFFWFDISRTLERGGVGMFGGSSRVSVVNRPMVGFCISPLRIGLFLYVFCPTIRWPELHGSSSMGVDPITTEPSTGMITTKWWIDWSLALRSHYWGEFAGMLLNGKLWKSIFPTSWNFWCTLGEFKVGRPVRFDVFFVGHRLPRLGTQFCSLHHFYRRIDASANRFPRIFMPTRQ